MNRSRILFEAFNLPIMHRAEAKPRLAPGASGRAEFPNTSFT
ncbi:hypothetical protein [Kibdelosporangium philippinense]|nr:hypothetical protein [Kibdelosporangium philippinense]